MASESPLLLGRDRDRWTLNLLRGTIQELVKDNYRIELHRPEETRPVLMRRLDNLLDRLRPDTVNMLTERHRQRNWRQEDIVRNRRAARPIARKVARRRRRVAVRANRVQPRTRLNLRNREPPLPAGAGVLNNAMQNPCAQSELSLDARAARTSQILRAVSGLTEQMRGRILELEAANDRLTAHSIEAETRRGIEADGLRGSILELEAANDRLRGRNLQLEMANRGLTANLHEFERAATAQAIEKGSHCAFGGNPDEAEIISMQEENTRFDEGTVGVSESAVRELVEINREKNDRWALSQDVLRGLRSDRMKVQLLDEVQGWDRAIAERNARRQRGCQ
ncbi:hypothetical protein BTUL_0001g00580 [Botrytis tulipae]|uniref:Uncharacterized protein n=1 Tax=Botrytis tulipae TaxID=87230 RepID=A0A4Z1FF63_9HELO|nr:hypothetical protein BTUL_0001g00580 [Botrytis tulipae]